jgi:His-Xaa-Ser system protein HxsD
MRRFRVMSQDNLKPTKILRIEHGLYDLSLNTAVYSLEAIKKTAYKFAGSVSVIIGPETGDTVSVVFNFVGKSSKADPEQVISDFCTELLDQDLRETVGRETGPIRNLILAHAFSRTRLARED